METGRLRSIVTGATKGSEHLIDLVLNRHLRRVQETRGERRLEGVRGDTSMRLCIEAEAGVESGERERQRGGGDVGET